jgi:nitrogen fixation protein FixH
MNRVASLFAGDRWIPLSFVGMFAVVLVANGALVYYALESWTGLDTENAYVKGLHFDDAVAAAAAQQALGWQAALSLDPQPGGARIELRLSQRDGRPLDRAVVTAQFVRPTQAGQDVSLQLDSFGGGLHRGVVALPLPGQWEVRLRVDRDGQTFRLRERFMLP